MTKFKEHQMWDYLTPANLLTMQRRQAIISLDQAIDQAWREGYIVEVDRLLDERCRMMALLSKPAS